MGFKKVSMVVLVTGVIVGSLMAQEFSFAGEEGIKSWKSTKTVKVKTGDDALTLTCAGGDAKIFNTVKSNNQRLIVFITIFGDMIVVVCKRQTTH